MVDTKVTFVPVTRGPELEEAVANLNDGEIVLVQNTRYEKGESKNDPELAKYWAGLGDLFVENAFGSTYTCSCFYCWYPFNSSFCFRVLSRKRS